MEETGARYGIAFVASGLKWPGPANPAPGGAFFMERPDALPLQRFADLKGETRTRAQSDSHTAA